MIQKRLVKLGPQTSSYKDKYGLYLELRTANEPQDIKELPNESFFYQRMLIQGILVEFPRDDIPLCRCEVCFAKGKEIVLKDIDEWYVHMRKEHKNL